MAAARRDRKGCTPSVILKLAERPEHVTAQYFDGRSSCGPSRGNAAESRAARQLGIRAAHALSHLNPQTAPRTDANAESAAARAAMIYAAVVLAVIAAVVLSVAALPHAGT